MFFDTGSVSNQANQAWFNWRLTIKISIFDGWRLYIDRLMVEG